MFPRHSRDTQSWLFSPRHTRNIHLEVFKSIQGGDISKRVSAFTGEMCLGMRCGDDRQVAAQRGLYFLIEVIPILCQWIC